MDYYKAIAQHLNKCELAATKISAKDSDAEDEGFIEDVNSGVEVNVQIEPVASGLEKQDSDDVKGGFIGRRVSLLPIYSGDLHKFRIFKFQ